MENVVFISKHTKKIVFSAQIIFCENFFKINRNKDRILFILTKVSFSDCLDFSSSSSFSRFSISSLSFKFDLFSFSCIS